MILPRIVANPSHYILKSLKAILSRILSLKEYYHRRRAGRRYYLWHFNKQRHC
nr:MAG TPA: hypothetical protein [Caudoviricetes sp.]